MNEIEVKVLGIDIEAVKDRIIKLGGKLVKKEIQQNYYYDLPPYIENQNGYIRLRAVHNLLDDSYKNILCIKKIIFQGNYRMSEEHEFEVLNTDECKRFFEAMELKFQSREDKYRESYFFKDALVEIDIWEKEVFPHPYIEIEAASEDKIYEILAALNIPKDKATSKNLSEIKKEMGII